MEFRALSILNYKNTWLWSCALTQVVVKCKDEERSRSICLTQAQYNVCQIESLHKAA